MDPGRHAKDGVDHDLEPRLSPDFAERVMRQVARIRTRRRIRGRIAATLAVAAVLIAVSVTAMLPTTPAHRDFAAQTPGVAAGWYDAGYLWRANSTGYSYGYYEDSRETTALNYMLPDAQSLIDFSNRYWHDSNSSRDYASWNF
jgi:hypothetical protein